MGTWLVPIWLLTALRAPGRQSAVLLQSQHLVRLLGQSLLYQGYNKFLGCCCCFFKLKVVLNFSGLCRKFGAFHDRHLFIIFSIQQHLSFFLPNGILMLQALRRPFCLQPWWKVTKDGRSKRSSSQDHVVRRNQPWTAMWYQLGHFALQEQCPSSCSPAVRWRVSSSLSGKQQVFNYINVTS